MSARLAHRAGRSTRRMRELVGAAGVVLVAVMSAWAIGLAGMALR